MVLDGLPGLYGFKYDSATACGLPLYLYSYKLVGSVTASLSHRGLSTLTLKIELLSGTAPISQRSYRMPPNELAELKVQL